MGHVVETWPTSSLVMVNLQKRINNLRNKARVRRKRVLKRDKSKCVYCGGNYMLTVDHKLPISRGGLSNFRNLQTTCKACNNDKGNLTHNEYLDKLALSPKQPFPDTINS